MIVAGFGFRGGATLIALRAVLACAGRGHPRVTTLAAPYDKRDLASILATEMGVPLILLSPDALKGVATPTSSPVSLARRGTGSVAEATALAAAGAGARLLTARHISFDRMATCAIARGSCA